MEPVRFKVIWIGKTTCNVPIGEVLSRFEAESNEMGSFACERVSGLTIMHCDGDDEEDESSETFEINSEMTNEQPTTADVSSIEEEDIQSNVLCESEKIDEIAVVINPDHIILTQAEKAQLFDDFDLDETDDEDDLITIHYQHFRPKQQMAFAAVEEAEVDKTIEESETETEIMVDIDQNAAKSENVVNGWSDDDKPVAEEVQQTEQVQKTEEENTATVTSCGWTINSDTEHEEGKRTVKIKSKSVSEDTSESQAGDIRERKHSESRQPEQHLQQQHQHQHQHQQHHSQHWGEQQRRHGNGNSNHHNNNNKRHNYQVGGHRERHFEKRNNQYQHNRQFDRAPGGSNRNRNQMRNSYNTKNRYRSYDDNEQYDRRVAPPPQQQQQQQHQQQQGQFPDQNNNNNQNWSWNGNFRNNYNQNNGRNCGSGNGGGVGGRPGNNNFGNQRNTSQGGPQQQQQPPPQLNNQRNVTVNDHCTRGDVNPNEKMKNDQQFEKFKQAPNDQWS